MSVRAFYWQQLLGGSGGSAPGATFLVSITSFTSTFQENTNLGTLLIGSFLGGPVDNAAAATVLSGSLGGSLVVTADPAVPTGNIYLTGTTGVTGTYSATVRFTSGAQVQDIVFTLTVNTTPPTLSLSFSPTSASRNYNVGVGVGAGGELFDILTYYSDSGGNVTQTGGTLPPGTSLQIVPTTGSTGQLRLVGTPTAAGTYISTLTFTSPGGAANFPTTFNVNSGGSIVNPLSFNGGGASANALDGTYIACTLSLNSNGVLTLNSTTSGAQVGSWFAPSLVGVGANHWARITLNGLSGITNGSVTPSSGWVSLAGGQVINVDGTFTFGAPFSANYTVQVAQDYAGTAVVASGNYTLSLTTTAPPPSGSVVNPLPGNGGNYTWLVTTGGVTVRVIFNGDGSWVADRQPPVTPLTTGSWYAPNEAGIGSSYYIRYTVLSGAPSNAGNLTAGVWSNIGGGASIGLNRSTIGVTTGTYQVDISTTADGSNIVGTGTYVITVEREFPG